MPIHLLQYLQDSLAHRAMLLLLLPTEQVTVRPSKELKCLCFLMFLLLPIKPDYQLLRKYFRISDPNAPHRRSRKLIKAPEMVVRKADQKDQRNLQIAVVSELEGSREHLKLPLSRSRDSPKSSHLCLKTLADRQLTNFQGSPFGSSSLSLRQAQTVPKPASQHLSPLGLGLATSNTEEIFLVFCKTAFRYLKRATLSQLNAYFSPSN